jgi:hypothetical protein
MNAVLKSGLVILFLIAAGIAFFLVSLYQAEWPRLRFPEHLKERISSAELHGWATQMLAPYQTNRDSKLWVEITNLPPAFRGLDPLPPIAFIRSDSEMWFTSTQAVPYIKVTYGSAAGHFGVLLGPTNLQAPIDRPHEVRYAAWTPGIWFFDGQ